MADELHIRLSGPYPAAQLGRLLHALDPLDRIEAPAKVALDLSGLARVGAQFVAVLVCTFRDRVAAGVLEPGSYLIPPKNALVRRWLERMDVLRLLVPKPPPEDFVRQEDRGFRPCVLFSNEEDLHSVADRLTSALTEACDTDATSRNATWFALNELAQNVVEHAQSTVGGAAVARFSTSSRLFEVAIADRGIGVRASLSRNPAYADVRGDLDALRLATTAGITAKLDKPGGLGLFVTQRLLEANGGALVIRSGEAELEVGGTPRESLALPLLRGTLVTVQFRSDRPFSLAPLLEASGAAVAS